MASPRNVARLAKAVRGRVAKAQDFPTLHLRQGKVSATPGGAVITITLGGSTTTITGVKYLASYTPATNDAIWVLEFGGDLIVLGKLA